MSGRRPHATEAICYAVIAAADGPAGLLLRHSMPDEQFEDGGQHASLRLAVDVVNYVGGYVRRRVNACALGIVGLSAARDGPFNRTGTELAHRLGAPPSLTIAGPLVLHAAPDPQGHIASLNDGQIRALLAITAAVNQSIHGRSLFAA